MEQSTNNVLVIGFHDDSKAYQALTELKQTAAQGRISLKSGAVVTHNADGTLKFEDLKPDFSIGDRTVGGGLIGALVGVLGGPLGVLFGWGAGSLIGMGADSRAVEDDLTMIELVGRIIPAGTTGVIAEAWEPAVEVVDKVVADLGGSVYRLPAADVQAEVDAAQEAEEAARKEANRVLRKERREEFTDKIKDAANTLKDKLTGND